MKWLAANWWWLAIVATVLINICNSVTAHWSERKGLVKWMLWLVDVLSVVRTEGGKLPLVPSGSTGIVDGKVIRAAVPLLFLAIAASGCCTSARCWLGKGLEGLHKADPLAIEAIKQVCAPKVQACVTATSCPALTQCEKALDVYRASADAAGRELDSVNKLLADLGVAK